MRKKKEKKLTYDPPGRITIWTNVSKTGRNKSAVFLENFHSLTLVANVFAGQMVLHDHRKPLHLKSEDVKRKGRMKEGRKLKKYI